MTPFQAPWLSDPHTSRVVLIGVPHYQHLPELPAVANNITQLRRVLTDPDLGGLAAEHCYTPPADTPASTLARTVRTVSAAADQGGLLLVYFAGHGLIEPYDRTLVLATADTEPVAPAEAGLDYELVRRAVATSPASRRLVILDCCYAGLAGGDMAGETSGSHAVAELAWNDQTCLMVSAARNGHAQAPVGAEFTTFTGALLEILEAGMPGEPPLLTVGAVWRQLLAVLTGHGGERPEIRAGNGGEDIPLVRNRARHEHDLTGRLVVAAPDTEDRELREAVVLVLRHDRSVGAVGIRLNRPSDRPPPVADQWRRLLSDPAVVFDGGPVSNTASDGYIAVVVLRADAVPPLRFHPIVDRLGTVPLTSRPIPDPSAVREARLFSGYLGWAPMQLEVDLDEGRLIRVPGHPHPVLATRPDAMWRDAIRKAMG